jgi:hypothetical protein
LILVALAHQSFRTARKARLRVEATDVQVQQPEGAVS